MKIKSLIFLWVFFLLGACTIKQEPLEIAHWRIMPQRQGLMNENQVKYWLTQGTISVTSPFDTKSFVYRLDEQKYEKDFYNEYVTLPSEMLAAATRQWMNDSGIFQFAVGNASALMPNYLLQGTVDEIYTDFRRGQVPTVVISVEYYLSVADGGKKNNVVFRKKYRQTEPIADNSAKTIAQSQQIALNKILMALEKDLLLESKNFTKP
jgi:cholesterol transport system auxiliary component